MTLEQRSLPDPLLGSDGRKVTTEEQWRSVRRPDILRLFRDYVYGREPVGRPEHIGFHVEKEDGFMEGAAIRKRVEIRFEGPGGAGAFRLLLFLPAKAAKPVPVFLLINNRGRAVADAERASSSPFWPAELIVSRGYAAALFHTEELDPDRDDGFADGVHGLFDPVEKPRSPHAWGTIAAWAWGACRAMDYLETDPDIDPRRVAVVGHSRGGKTALWAGAIDPRFAMVVSNNSGCTGAALSRGKRGETIRDINARFPHWFCETYKSFDGRENELPVDQHMLLSLIAPRALYVSSATEDLWADPESEFLSLIAAEPVYRLFGSEGLGTASLPPADTPVFGSGVGYHIRTGKHDMGLSDWRHFIDFADRAMRAQ
ncbi:dienelactone hydrolase family protein [Paenibacillus flagellatus]|uniref:Acetylxylan esterase n=1 Tax=Paenibacillus flagellatus TaxID=2211139 RepID=A0A2V5K7E6_9BACL|nr:acetylxylan esterase [Paenibacillus flagellatus]PYI53904.1 acetylxylan esterase [Paenibacillus flagellatus]